jgi:hypothetical protein
MVESWIILHHHGRIMDNTRDLAPIAKRSNAKYVVKIR